MVSQFVAKTKAAIAQITDPELSLSNLDLTNCDREPIHIPGYIQPHGVMLVLYQVEREWTIIHVSSNTAQYLAISPHDLLNQPLSTLLNPAQIEQIECCLSGDFDAVNPLRLELNLGELTQDAQPADTQPADAQTATFSGIVHRADHIVILELEPASDADTVNFFNFHTLVKRPVNRLQQTSTLAELAQVTVEEVQRITGYDRVMVYELAEDGSGSVIAEVKRAEDTPYLGLHYPATDITKQAKYLYLLNLLRLVPDVTYKPVPLVTGNLSGFENSEQLSAPVDMSCATLRSVSPVHVEYLANMGVRATMAVSLVRNQKLWGLIVCHHQSPRTPAYELRTVCEFLGRVVALELNTKIDNEDNDYKLQLKALQTEFFKALPKSDTLKGGLTHNTDNLLALTGSVGAAFCEKGDITLLGETPAKAEVSELISWVCGQFEDSTVYHTAALIEDYPPAASFAGHTSGLLALSISKVQEIYVLWFRPEVLHTVNWAGKPEKSSEVDEQNEVRMSPRQSFEKWQQTVVGQSLPWKPWEVEAALELRSSVISLVLQKADELAQLNSELKRSNVELDSFAYIASHDLKEPLRGIHNYASFLIEDYGEQLGEDGNEKLNTLLRLTQRMESLISSLLHYSRLGRVKLVVAPIDFNEVVSGVIELVNMNNSETIRFEIPRSLPTVSCDRVKITELFTNLITNGVKYNDKAEKTIEIGYLDGESFPGVSDTAMNQTVFYVRDNGIGIKEQHLEAVFRIFKRLHAPKRYGGGTGAGLTIAKKIVEKHGGSLWIESSYGEGSTFYFTLNPAAENLIATD